MTSHVLTLIGNAMTAPLTTDHVAMVRDRFALGGDERWLAEREACEIAVDANTAPPGIGQEASVLLAGFRIDVSFTAADNRRKKILISDMDSTIINQECINEMGAALRIGPRIREITTDVINGNINFAEALRQRMALMRGLERHALDAIYRERITLVDGARTLVATMRHHGAYCVLVSGGFTFFTRRIAARVGFDDQHGNELEFESGKLTGRVLEPIRDETAKRDLLFQLCAARGCASTDALAVGDGANDIPMIAAAGLGVAFRGAEGAIRAANASIVHNDLTALLYIQGYPKRAFITA